MINNEITGKDSHRFLVFKLGADIELMLFYVEFQRWKLIIAKTNQSDERRAGPVSRAGSVCRDLSTSVMMPHQKIRISPST